MTMQREKIMDAYTKRLFSPQATYFNSNCSHRTDRLAPGTFRDINVFCGFRAAEDAIRLRHAK